MSVNGRGNIQIPLALAENGLLDKSTLVEAVQVFVQAEGPLTEEEAERFTNLVKDSPFANNPHIRITNG
jgi:hypothetical protein